MGSRHRTAPGTSHLLLSWRQVHACVRRELTSCSSVRRAARLRAMCASYARFCCGAALAPSAMSASDTCAPTTHPPAPRAHVSLSAPCSLVWLQADECSAAATATCE